MITAKTFDQLSHTFIADLSAGTYITLQAQDNDAGGNWIANLTTFSIAKI